MGRLASSAYQPDMAVLSALLLIGLALGGSMFYVLVFPVLNFHLSNVTIKPGDFVQWKNLDDSPHTATATSVPPGATKFDSGELDSGNTFFVQLTTPGVYKYHCNFHPLWMRAEIIVAP